MISILEQQTMLLNISRQLKKEITAFAIGGTAMMFHNLKDSTKDIDIVFTSNEDRKDFIIAAKKVGWTELNAELIYGKRKDIPIMLKLVEERLDLFLNQVIDFTCQDALANAQGFSPEMSVLSMLKNPEHAPEFIPGFLTFSKEMQKRATMTRQFEKNLIIKIADEHDIILMKCATDRLKDIDDARVIITSREINWQIISEEARNQLSLGNEKALMELGRFIEILKPLIKEKDIPDNVLDELWELFVKQIEEKRKKLKGSKKA